MSPLTNVYTLLIVFLLSQNGLIYMRGSTALLGLWSDIPGIGHVWLSGRVLAEMLGKVLTLRLITDIYLCTIQMNQSLSFGIIIRGDVKILHSWMTKNVLGNIGNLFVKHMREVTKDHLYHLLGVSDYYVM